MTSDLYPTFTKTTSSITITIANECALTALTMPASSPAISDLEFTVGTTASTTISLFAHDQDANCKFDNQIAVITPVDGSSFGSHSAWITLNYLTLTVYSSDESLESRDHIFTYKETVSANSQLVTSPETSFKITIIQEKCRGVEAGSYQTSAIRAPKHGADSGSATSLLLDGTTVVITMPDWGDSSTFFFDQKSTFDASDERCGPRLITVAAGMPAWFTVTQDGADSSKFLINAKPSNKENEVIDLSVTLTYTRYPSYLKSDFAFKLEFKDQCSIDTFLPTKSSDEIYFYFSQDPSDPAETFQVPAWVQTQADGKICSLNYVVELVADPAEPRLTLDANTRVLSYVTSAVTQKYDTATIKIKATASTAE